MPIPLYVLITATLNANVSCLIKLPRFGIIIYKYRQLLRFVYDVKVFKLILATYELESAKWKPT